MLSGQFEGSIRGLKKGMVLACALALAGCAADGDRLLLRDRGNDQVPESLRQRSTSEVSLQDPFEQQQESILSSERVVRGTGVFVGQPESAGVDLPGEESGVLLNFVEADIKEVVQIVLGDTLGVSYLLDPRVQGTITLRSVDELRGESLLAVLEAGLRTVNAALITDQGVYRIIPLSEAPRGGLRSALALPGGSVPPGYALSVVPLQYVSAQAMTELLAPIIGADAQVRPDPARNIILVAAPAQQTQSITEAITLFDVDLLAGLSLGLFPLEEVSADVIAAELQSVLEAQSGQSLNGVLSITPVTRLNAVLVATKQPSYISRIRMMLAELDRATGEGMSLYVYPVQNGLASDLAALLNEMFSGQTRSTTAGAVAPGIRSTSLSRQNTNAQPQGGQAGAAVRSVVAPSAAGAGAGLQVRVIADDTNNALVIMANARDYKIVERALAKLDIQPLQLLIEATIAEVSLNDSLRYGVQFLLEDTLEGGALDSVQGILTQGSDTSISPTVPGFATIVNASNGDVRAILSALETLTEVKIVSTPSLLVRDNQTAELQVGDEVPVQTQRIQTAGGGSDVLFNTSIEFIDTGVLLTVTPRITSGGLITLEIEQEVSTVSQVADTGTLTPTISTRRITSSISVSDRETVVLGGLISETSNTSRTGVPLVSRLPVLGALFSNRENQTDRTELVILIRPTIVGNREELREVTNELLDRLQGVGEELRAGG